MTSAIALYARTLHRPHIAHAVAFFADPATRYITGQVLIIDGGRSVGLSPS
jgi:NAD(P)-dependent dehydrogenase (short-subunit alcohol dehydrogenase family)